MVALIRKEDTTSRQQANGIETAGSGKDLGSGFGPWLIKPAAASSNLRLTYSYPGRFTRVYNKPYSTRDPHTLWFCDERGARRGRNERVQRRERGRGLHAPRRGLAGAR